MPSVEDIVKQITSHKTRVYFEQDGGNFYLFVSVHAAECGDSMEMVTAPYQVKDSDLDAAGKAREWFLTEYCREKNLLPCSVFE